MRALYPDFWIVGLCGIKQNNIMTFKTVVYIIKRNFQLQSVLRIKLRQTHNAL